ncbi:aminotransferase class V-fold PLP-dependent enzyme [Mesorhizobium sp. B2-4-15]|uniref:cysteine desulfurase family protein n=1 Tax=Mesorhizobium sp. B2-4-15 TaxID=2589934 RepID=UPI0011501FC3|nr:aminotransferase class V-fold PLP-dependent enzyme [Mesorhizobium sp. B2-4-15]TPK59098.1 aminotransferase class V-fold PLP-dependent enzyme [Mesorhizobium sp. B2-4-15]
MPGGIYLDHNATTPVDPRVRAAMLPYFEELFGNASSVEHAHGHAAGRAVDGARERVAAAIGARANEILFTSGCTEANNLAILGTARANPTKRHIVTSAIEHPAVLEPCRALERDGWRVSVLDVDEAGRIDLDTLKASLCDDTALVSIMAANNEVGTRQPIAEIGALCAEREILFHCDAAQIGAYGLLDVERDNVHLASLSAHKAYGPKGIGALYIRSRRPRVRVAPIVFGGGQERGLRPGTLNTPAIVGMGEAMAIAARQGRDDAERLRGMTALMRERFEAGIAGLLFNGDPEWRIANNLSVSIPGVEPLALIRRLREEISFSASSACATEKIETSPVLLAMFGDTARARAAFRVSPGRFTTEDEMSRATELIIAESNRLAGSPAAVATTA